MNKYLLEIGTEELPSGFIDSALVQLKNNFSTLMVNNGINYEKINTFATPRRLSVIIENFDLQQEDSIKILKGPSINVAYDSENKLTSQALGFMKKNNIDQSDTYVENNYLFGKKFQIGKSFEDIIRENVQNCVLSIDGSHFMRWEDLNYKFQRPIRWIVSILNDKHLKIEIANVVSSIYSFGHRFKCDKVEITNVDDYFDTLLQNNVIVDQNIRKNKIIESAHLLAKSNNLDIVLDDDLLNEVNYLCEWPKPVLCSFDEKYLNLPEKLIVTVMSSHQRYFPLYSNGKLANKFITMANYTDSDLTNIINGNQRVIFARLEDAIFFFEEDTKVPLDLKLDSLKGITFQKNFGSLYDKTIRICEISKFIANMMNITSHNDIYRTALLCKCDLATKLVFEFTELQGYIGSYYASLNGERENVVNGILEHYFPLNASSKVSSHPEGQIVGISDKIDNIVSVFASSKKPTGSNDPLGLRRAALGIIRTIIDNNLNIDLIKVIDYTIALLYKKPDNIDFLKSQVIEFFNARICAYFGESYKYDIIDCVMNSSLSPLANLNDFIIKLNLITDFSSQSDFNLFCDNAKRIYKILEKTPVSINKVSTNLFESKEEEELYFKISQFDYKNKNYNEILLFLKSLIPLIINFFDHVLIMANNIEIKNNRIAILNKVYEVFHYLGDFSKIV